MALSAAAARAASASHLAAVVLLVVVRAPAAAATGAGAAGCGCSLGFGATEGGSSRGDGACQAAATAAAFIAPSLPPGISVAMATIAAGEYTVGTDAPQLPGDPDGESPARRVQFRRPFRLDLTAVTRADFARFVLVTGHRTDAELSGESFVPDFLVSAEAFHDPEVVPGRVADVPWWLPVRGATWRRPRGPAHGNGKVVNSSQSEPLSNKDQLSKKDQLSNKGHPSDKDHPSNEDQLTNKDYDRHPVVHVSWRDAEAYCRWAGKRLPTEDEWEAACRAGLADRLFPWGNAPLPAGRHRMNIWQGEFPRVNTAEDGHVSTAPVDAYGPQNSLGLYNMVGNVWEWTASRWDRRTGSPAALVGQADEMSKRGGSFMCHKSYCYRYRCAARSSNTADTSSANIGFRCASDA